MVPLHSGLVEASGPVQLAAEAISRLQRLLIIAPSVVRAAPKPAAGADFFRCRALQEAMIAVLPVIFALSIGLALNALALSAAQVVLHIRAVAEQRPAVA